VVLFQMTSVVDTKVSGIFLYRYCICFSVQSCGELSCRWTGCSRGRMDGSLHHAGIRQPDRCDIQGLLSSLWLYFLVYPKRSVWERYKEWDEHRTMSSKVGKSKDTKVKEMVGLDVMSTSCPTVILVVACQVASGSRLGQWSPQQIEWQKSHSWTRLVHSALTPTETASG